MNSKFSQSRKHCNNQQQHTHSTLHNNNKKDFPLYIIIPSTPFFSSLLPRRLSSTFELTAFPRPACGRTAAFVCSVRPSRLSFFFLFINNQFSRFKQGHAFSFFFSTPLSSRKLKSWYKIRNQFFFFFLKINREKPSVLPRPRPRPPKLGDSSTRLPLPRPKAILFIFLCFFQTFLSDCVLIPTSPGANFSVS